MGDFIRKDMTELVRQMGKDRVMVKFPVGHGEEAREALQDDYINDLINAIIETMESNVTIEYDENEDGKFTYATVDTPSAREQLKDDIAEYILEKR